MKLVLNIVDVDHFYVVQYCVDFFIHAEKVIFNNDTVGFLESSLFHDPDTMEKTSYVRENEIVNFFKNNSISRRICL